MGYCTVKINTVHMTINPKMSQSDLWIIAIMNIKHYIVVVYLLQDHNKDNIVDEYSSWIIIKNGKPETLL